MKNVESILERTTRLTGKSTLSLHRYLQGYITMLWKVHFRLSLCRQVREKVETCHLSLRSWPRQRRLYYILIRFHVIDLDYWILFLYQQFIRNGRGSHGKNKWCAPLQGFYTSAATNMNAGTNRQVLLLNLASTSSSNYTSSTSSSMMQTCVNVTQSELRKKLFKVNSAST